MSLRSNLTNPNESFFPDEEILKKIVAPITVLLLGLFFLSSNSDPSLLLVGLLGISVGISAVYITWNYPEIGILGLLFLEANIILPDQLVDLRLGGGGLDLRDMVLLGTFGIVFAKELYNRRIDLKLFPVSGLLVLFLLLASFSLVNALVFEKASFNWAFNDYRLMLYYTLFFTVSWGIKNNRQFKTFLFGLYSLSSFVVLLMVMQPFWGKENLLLPGMARWQITEEASGALRILPPVILLIAILIVVTICYSFFTSNRRYRMIAIAQSIFLTVGFVLTYTRSAWVTVVSAVLFVMMYMLYTYRERGVVLVALLSPILLSIGIFFLTVPASSYGDVPLVGQVLDRGASIFDTDEAVESDSLQWRVFENGAAMQSISENPLFGVGLGNQYRELTLRNGEAAGTRTTNDITRLTRYVHNSFLSLAVKMGVPTLVLFLTMYAVFVYKAWHWHTMVRNALHKGITLGAAIIFIPCLFWAQFFPLFTESNHIATIAIFMGLVAVIAELRKKELAELNI